MGRPFAGCSGLALCGYSLLNASSSAFDIVACCCSTSHRTPSLQGGVVSEPSNA